MHPLTVNGEMAERLNAAVLKTVLVKANGGSNPSFSASPNKPQRQLGFFVFDAACQMQFEQA